MRTTAWWLWITLQLALLLLAAERVSLAASFPQPVEDSAGAMVAVGQIVFAILLAPALLPDGESVVRAFAGGAPILIATHLLAGESVSEVLVPLLLLALWLVTLCSSIAFSVARPALALAAIAAPVLLYAANESVGIKNMTVAIAVSPSIGAVAVSLNFNNSLWAFAGVGILLTAEIAAKFATKSRRSEISLSR